jgi:hypothetical protein
MMTAAQLYGLIEGILAADNATKQKLGQRFAKHLGLNPGPRGPDDGVDGWLEVDDVKVHFQCKLANKELDKTAAREYWSDVDFHGAQVSIILAGRGFKDTFDERISGQSNYDNLKIHKLTLEDLFLETPAFQAALKDLPLLKGIQQSALE